MALMRRPGTRLAPKRRDVVSDGGTLGRLRINGRWAMKLDTPRRMKLSAAPLPQPLNLRCDTVLRMGALPGRHLRCGTCAPHSALAPRAAAFECARCPPRLPRNHSAPCPAAAQSAMVFQVRWQSHGLARPRLHPVHSPHSRLLAIDVFCASALHELLWHHNF